METKSTSPLVTPTGESQASLDMIVDERGAPLLSSTHALPKAEVIRQFGRLVSVKSIGTDVWQVWAMGNGTYHIMEAGPNNNPHAGRVYHPSSPLPFTPSDGWIKHATVGDVERLARRAQNVELVMRDVDDAARNALQTLAQEVRARQQVARQREDNLQRASENEIKNRALVLLEEHLTPEQLGQWVNYNYFDVTAPSGRRYRITAKHAMNVYYLDPATQQPVMEYCVVPRRGHREFPLGDTLLMQAIMLQTDENAFLTIANKMTLYDREQRAYRGLDRFA